MKIPSFLRNVAIAASAIFGASALVAQTNSIQLFGPANVRLSLNGTSNSNPNTFNSATLQLSCPAGAPITAVLSSTPDGTGNVLVDNFVNLTVTQGEFTSGPTNVCRGGISESGYNDCFTSGYQIPASEGLLTGQDPDNFTSTGGVTPIDLSESLLSGSVQVKFDLVDTGGYLASSSLYLNTNCSQTGVTGPATITGNPISSTNPTPAQLTQNFSFDSSTDQKIQLVYDLSQANGSEELSITNGATPNVADQPIDPTTWIPVWVPGTSFATSSCLTHTGELLPSGSPACKLYTLQCNVGQETSQSGAQCPVSQLPNEAFIENFDGPSFTLPDITVPSGPTFHQGVGFLMASEGWTGGQCQFDQSTDFASILCPQNLLVDFSGPGLYTSTDYSTHPNSSFIVVAPVPEDLTTATVAGQKPGGWINSDTANVTFSSQPPTFAGVVSPPPGAASFVPAPIQSITYGISPASSVPSPKNQPISGDTTLTNTIACPTSSNPTNPTATTFTPPQQSISFSSDGMYLLHYFARDCASTEELKFTQGMTGSWSTSFYTVPVNVDTQAPVVASGPTLSPPPSTNNGVANSYTKGTSVMATYSCTDSLSGVVTCGASTFPAGTLNTGNISTPVDTSSTGTKTFTVNVTDAAGNNGTPVSVQYTVVSQTSVDLAVLKLAPLAVKQGSQFAYNISASNFGANPATGVVVTDPLPAGVSFVSLNAQLLTCGFKGCSLTSENSNCSHSGSTVTCTLDSLGVTNWTSVALFNLTINVRATGSAGSILSNITTITSSNTDTHPGDNHSTAITKITR
jgi:uncharacterized repeat protein (TIGR01451 family)